MVQDIRNSGEDAVDAFLEKMAKGSSSAHRGRLIFALDATASRQETWDTACHLQAEMFREAAAIGGLDVQLVYYRGLSECRASRWVSQAERLGSLMERIDCRAGHTQIGKVIAHAKRENQNVPVQAMVFVGDAMEERPGELCDAAAGLKVPVFVFQEGDDDEVKRVFEKIARLTKGAYGSFDTGAASQLRALLRSVAAYAAGGILALENLSHRDKGAARLLAQLK